MDDFGLKPYWQSARRLLRSRKSITLLWMHLSRALEINERREIGR